MTQLSPPRRSTDLESVNASIKARAAGKSITLDVQQSRQPIGNTLAPASKCKVGICYRPEEPFDLVLFVDKAEYDRTSLLLPTKAKLVEIPVTRAAFVEKTTTIDFEAGPLKQVDIAKPGEVLAIGALPVELLKAIRLEERRVGEGVWRKG